MTKHTDIQQKENIDRGLTFDDVLLQPSYSAVLPKGTKTNTKLTKNISLNIPIVSAAMDTVTECEMAIALSRQGGIGILHKNLTIAKQTEQVRKVKRTESGMIVDPITLKEDATVLQAKKIMAENKIGGIPIVNDQNILNGILTNRDLRFETQNSRKVSDIMTKDNLITAPEGTNLKKATQILRQYKIEKLPVINANNQLTGLITYKDLLQTQNFPNASKDSIGRLLVGAAIGINKESYDRVASLVSSQVDVICIDSAHAHSKSVITLLEGLKQKYPHLEIIVGNVGTYQGAKILLEKGADAIKVGVGPGSICTTRIVTGVGIPQLTAIINCSKAVKGTNVPIIADGGIRYSGDLVKALAAGASAVMLGSILAGTEESPGETIIYDGRKFKTYRGMGSMGAMEQGGGDRYFQDTEPGENKKFVPEGIEGRVPYKGKVEEVVYNFVGGLKSGMGYCGAKVLEELRQAKFVQISNAGVIESHTHNIEITKEAPNYSK